MGLLNGLRPSVENMVENDDSRTASCHAWWVERRSRPAVRKGGAMGRGRGDALRHQVWRGCGAVS